MNTLDLISKAIYSKEVIALIVIGLFDLFFIGARILFNFDKSPEIESTKTICNVYIVLFTVMLLIEIFKFHYLFF